MVGNGAPMITVLYMGHCVSSFMFPFNSHSSLGSVQNRYLSSLIANVD